MESEGFLVKDDNLMIRKNVWTELDINGRKKCWNAEIWKDTQLNDKKNRFGSNFCLDLLNFRLMNFLCSVYMLRNGIDDRIKMLNLCAWNCNKKYADNLIISSFETWILNRNCLPHQNSDSFNKFKIRTAEQILV